MGNCIATTAVQSCWTSPCAIPLNGSVRVDAGGLAGVEQDQPQRVVVAQVRAEDGRADLGAAAVPVLEVDDAVLDPVVVVAVADEVEDVDVVLPQPRRERLDGRRRQPVDLHGAFVDLVRQRVLNASPLGLDVELGQVGGRGDDDEDAQRAVDGQRPRRLRHLEVADHRGALGLGDEAVPAAVVEQLPRQTRDRRCVGEPQSQPQPVAVLAGVVLGALPGQHDVLGEHALEQRSAQVHRRLALRVGPGPPGAGAAGVQLEQQVLQLRRVERKREPATGALVERALRHPRAESAALRRFEQEVEVLIGPGGHRRPFRLRSRLPSCWSREVA